MKTQPLCAPLFIAPLALLLAGNAQAQLNISDYTGTPYTQNFDTLANSGTANAWIENSTLPGWYANQTKTPFVVANLRASTGSDNTGGFYSYGASASTERALGALPTGTPGDIAYGLRFTNDTALAMSNIVVSFTGEQWRRATSSGTQTVAFSYAISTDLITNADPAGTIYSWTAVPALDFNSPTLGAAGALDGNASTNRQALSSSLSGVMLLPGKELFLRWLDVDDSSAIDHGMGIDELSVSFTPVTFNDPAINTPPAARTNAVHTTATFSVGAAGLSTLYYQWLRGTSPLSDGGNISGATNDTLVISQVLHTDAANYSVIVSNTAGSLTSAPVALTVVGFAIAPVSPTNTLAGSPVTVDLSFIDNQTPVTGAAGTSSDQAILPDANISAAAAGDSGTATLTPLAGTGGVVLASVSTTDGSFTTNAVFPLVVVPSTNVIFNDYFNYPEGAIITGSHGLWVHESGTLGDMVVSGGELQVSRSLSEDNYAQLIGQPYLTTGDAVLYSRFKVRFTTLPSAGGAYFAHFRDAAGTGQRARIWASITNAATGKFRLGIGNGSASTATTAQVAQDLDTNVTYTVVTRLDVASAVSSLWINPTSESNTDPAQFATAADVSTTVADITSYGFRQASGEGIMLVDDLVIGKTFAAVSLAPTPVSLSITRAGADAILSWSDPSGQFKLASGTNVAAITNVVSTTSPYTNTIAEPQQFFRLVYP
jgi:hypothetical protein